MRVIVWGINYAPELTGIAPFNTGLCDFLREQGHDVEMVTTFPYYPFWRKIPGDDGRLFRTDDLDGVPVHRCWHYVPRRVTTLSRIWHELSFGLTSFWRILRLPAADIYFVVSPPLILGPLASLAGWWKRRQFVFHVQDLQPDAALGLGMVKPGLFTLLLYRIEAWAYRDAAVVSGISRGMIAAFTRKGVPETKRLLFPNWIRWYGRNAGVRRDEADRRKRRTEFRRKFGISESAFVASYSGNLGRKQGLETLVEAAKLVAGNSRSSKTEDRRSEEAEREIVILIVGDGAMREELEWKIASVGLRGLRLMPLLQETDYHGLLAASDVSLILQAPGTGQYFFPSKLLSTLSVGTPALSAADETSELAVAVKEGNFGRNVPAADPEALAYAIVALAGDSESLARLQTGTAWVEQFSGENVLRRFEEKLLELTVAKRRV